VKTTDCTNCGHSKEAHSLPSLYPEHYWANHCSECQRLEEETKRVHQCYGGYSTTPGGGSDWTCTGWGGHHAFCKLREAPHHKPYTHCGCGAELPAQLPTEENIGKARRAQIEGEVPFERLVELD